MGLDKSGTSTARIRVAVSGPARLPTRRVAGGTPPHPGPGSARRIRSCDSSAPHRPALPSLLRLGWAPNSSTGRGWQGPAQTSRSGSFGSAVCRLWFAASCRQARRRRCRPHGRRASTSIHACHPSTRVSVGGPLAPKRSSGAMAPVGQAGSPIRLAGGVCSCFRLRHPPLPTRRPRLRRTFSRDRRLCPTAGSPPAPALRLVRHDRQPVLPPLAQPRRARNHMTLSPAAAARPTRAAQVEGRLPAWLRNASHG